MKNNYDFSKAKRGKVDPEAGTTMTSFRMDNYDITLMKAEADRLGVPYQTLLKSVLHRYVIGELVDRAEARKIVSSKKKAS